MTTTVSRAATAAQLRRLLETIGDALVGGRADLLLSTEVGIESAVHALRSLPDDSDDSDGEQFNLELKKCGAALDRCRRLGAAGERLAVGLLQIVGPSAAYTRDGAVAATRLHGCLEVRG